MAKKFELKEITNFPTYEEKITQINQYIKSMQSNIDGADELWETLKTGLQSIITEIIGYNVEVDKVESNRVCLIINDTIVMKIDFPEESEFEDAYVVKLCDKESYYSDITLTEESYKLIRKLHSLAPEIAQRVKKSKKRLDKVTSKKNEIKKKITVYITEQVEEYNNDLKHFLWSQLINGNNETLIVQKKSGRDIIWIKNGMVYTERKPIKLDTYLKKFFNKGWSFRINHNSDYRTLPSSLYMYI